MPAQRRPILGGGNRADADHAQTDRQGVGHDHTLSLAGTKVGDAQGVGQGFSGYNRVGIIDLADCQVGHIYCTGGRSCRRC